MGSAHKFIKDRTQDYQPGIPQRTTPPEIILQAQISRIWSDEMTIYDQKASRFIYYYILFIVGVVTFILAMGMFGSFGLITWLIVIVVLAILVVRKRRKVVKTR